MKDGQSGEAAAFPDANLESIRRSGHLRVVVTFSL